MQVKFDFNRRNIMDALLVIQLILLIILGGYNVSLSKKVGKLSLDGEVVTAPVKNNDTGGNKGTAAAPAAPAGKATFNITKDDHVWGDFNAPVTLVEFSDLQCPFCSRHHPNIKKLLEEYKGKVRVVWKHFPLSFHPFAQKAAEGSECASEQGKFREFVDLVFMNQQKLSLKMIKDQAKLLKLNTSKFDKCLDSGKYEDKVKKDVQEGAVLGVKGTPANFINGELVSGAVPYAQLTAKIDALLK